MNEDRLREDFEWLHRNPELAFAEYHTTEYIRAALQQAGVRILPYALETGVVAEIGTKGPAAALRADIDALPVREETDLPYASQTEGRMHACGHDFHTAVLLEAARRLQAEADALPGRVRLLFQPGEESSAGALKILEAGALEGVGAIFALHTSPLFAAGTVAVRPGAASAAVDRFEIRVHGRGTHAAAPELGIDPIVAGAAVVSAVQTIVSRSISPCHAALVSITHFAAGNTWNVIPDEAFLEGTVRTLDAADRTLVRTRLAAAAQGAASACGASAELCWHAGPPATANDPAWTKLAAETALCAQLPAAEDPPSMLGEDFAYYQEKVPGVYIHFGIGLTAPNHNPKFCVDEAALAPAAAYSAALAKAALGRLAQQGRG